MIFEDSMEDLVIYCVQCEAPFVFPVAEQQRYADHNFDPPTRCPECRKNKSRSNQNDHRRTREEKWKMKRNRKTLDY